jgi:N-acylglucosamine-6-phosphate 2-epimerase
MLKILDTLRGGLIVSVQAKAGSALDDPPVLAALARAAQDAGAVGVRIQGIANLHAVRQRVEVPIIGLIKCQYPGFEPYITPTLKEVTAILRTGAEVVAFDATQYVHPSEPVTEIVAAIHKGNALAMADCATEEDGRAAIEAGADIIGTTLAGYTRETRGTSLPAIDLVRSFKLLASRTPQRTKPETRKRGVFVICEGGIHTPQQGREAFDAGADAIVVGTAITDISWLVNRFILP